MSATHSAARAGHWFLHSGIQEPWGGVARYYRADLHQNKAVSTEITGYTASALAFLFAVSQDEAYLDRARLTARFLCDCAWDPVLGTFPFEHPSPSPASEHRSYFFDCGIVIRGLVAVWRITREDRLIELARDASKAMIADFHSGKDYHPILTLPDKRPLARTPQWSRSPGCYQTKSALAWWEVAEATGDHRLRDAYLEALDAALHTYRGFLADTTERLKIMDRLHAYSYFLEALTPMLNRADCAEAYRFTLDAVARNLRDIAPEFARSDVYAQLLRARIYGSPVAPLDTPAAEEEATALAAFQAASEDPRIDGAFWFGRRGGQFVPHANPVSTAFAVQALYLWENGARKAGIPCHQPPL